MPAAFVFPGQGSQSVGMLAQLAADAPVVREVFDVASAALGYDLWQRVQEGPEEALNATECTQPAMLAAGVATWRAWSARGGGTPACTAGHSLGEFTALVAAGSLDFAQAIALARFRGGAMQEAVPRGSGAMAAILGLDDADVEAACAEAAQGSVVEAVNYNAQGQVVIAGETAAVARAIEAAKARGAKRAVTLPVSVPAHSQLMKGAAEKLRVYLQDVEIRAPRLTWVSAVDAKVHADPEDIRALLVRQLASPVRWTDTVQALVGAGYELIAECGPGRVLTSLNKRITKGSTTACVSLDDAATMDAAMKGSS